MSFADLASLAVSDGPFCDELFCEKLFCDELFCDESNGITAAVDYGAGREGLAQSVKDSYAYGGRVQGTVGKTVKVIPATVWTNASGEIAIFWDEHNHPGLFESGWALRIGMAMEPPDSLQEDVHRTEIGNHHIRVKVQTLLNSLGGNRDATMPRILAATYLAEGRFDRAVQQLPILP